MLSLHHILVTDTPGAAPRPEEVVVWVGASRPPLGLVARSAAITTRTSSEAIALVRAASAVVRLDLQQPLAFATALTAADAAARARAA